MYIVQQKKHDCICNAKPESIIHSEELWGLPKSDALLWWMHILDLCCFYGDVLVDDDVQKGGIILIEAVLYKLCCVYDE